MSQERLQWYYAESILFRGTGNSMGYSCWGVVLTTHFLLVPGCKWVGAIAVLPFVLA